MQKDATLWLAELSTLYRIRLSRYSFHLLPKSTCYSRSFKRCFFLEVMTGPYPGGGTMGTCPPQPSKTCFFFAYFPLQLGSCPPPLRGGTEGAQYQKNPFLGVKFFSCSPPARGLATALMMLYKKFAKLSEKCL